MSAQDGPPQGMETKNVPGYVPAPVVNPDHPGHFGNPDQGGFAGTAGYTNTPGILDPEPQGESGTEAQGEGDSADGGKTTAAKKTTATGKSSGTPAKSS